MLQLFDKNKNKIFGLIEYKDLCIESVLEDGDKTLSFLYSKNSKYYFDIEEEGYIRTKQDEFVIKEKDIQDNYTTFICKLNIEELEGKTFDRYESIEQTITVALNLAIVGTGWTVAENSLKKKRTVRKTNCSSWDIIKEIKSTYRVDIIFNTLEKKIEIYEHLGKDKGTYFIEDLNLKSLQVQSNSYSYVTRIIPVGKDGLTIESINNNKNYVENYQYSNKVKTIYWNDDRYTIKESLLEDAKAKLNELSKPYRAYTASIINLSKLNPKYNILDYKLGDDITLISKRNKIKEKQRIIKTIEYPQDHNKDTIELANATLKFEDIQSQFQDAADTVDNVTLDDGTLDGEAFKDGGISSNKIENFKANVIEAAEIHVIKADIQDLNAEVLKAGQAILTKVDATQLNALESKLQHALIGKADINELNVAVERVGIIEGKTASIENALNKNLTAENFQANAITAGSGIIADGAIGSAQISDLDVNKLNAGTLDTSKIQILGPNGRFRIIGNKLQVLDDKNGKLYERIMLGVDDNNKSTLALRGKDGQTTLIDENGLTDAGFTNGYGKVNDNSLDASKFDKNSIVRQVNGSTETIKGTKVQIGDRTLDVELSTQKNSIIEHGKEISTQKAIIQALDDQVKLKVDTQTFKESTNSINTSIINAKNSAVTEANKHSDTLATKLKSDAEKYANDVAIAKSELAKQQAIANADGKISAEEQKRVDEAKKNLDTAIAKANAAESNAKAHADQVAEQKKQDAIKTANTYTTAQITTTNSNLSKATSDINILKEQISTKVGQTDIDRSISNIKLGGRNLLIGGQFGAYSDYNAIVSTNGSKYVKSQWNVACKINIFTLNNGTYKPKGTHTISGFIKVNGSIPNSKYFTGLASTYGNNLVANYYDNKTGYFYITQDYPGDSQWILHAPTTRLAQTADVIELINVKLEKGTKATDYTEAPEDINQAIIDSAKKTDEKITTIETELKQTKESFGVSVKDLNSKTSTIETNLTNTTKNLDTKINTAKIDAINSALNSTKAEINNAKVYAEKVAKDNSNIAKEQAINTASADATKKADNAKTQAINSANSYTNTAKQQAIDSANSHANSIAETKKNEAINQANKDTDTKIDNLQIGGRNLVRIANIGKYQSSGTFDPSTNTWNLTAANGAGGYWGAGLGINGNKTLIPYGQTYILSFEVKVPIACTFNADINCFPIEGTAWSGNDNDNVNKRKTSNKNLVPNKWIKCWISYENTSSQNKSFKDIYDNTVFGIINNTGSNMNFQIRNVKGELGTKPTDWTPAPEDVELNIDTAKQQAIKESAAKATEAENKAKKYADEVAIAKANLAQTMAQSYADGKVSTEEKARIKQAQDNLNTAVAKATAAKNEAITQAEKTAEAKVNLAKAYADDVANKKAELAKQQAIANADGKISEEEKKRIKQAQDNLNTAIAKASAAETNARNYANQVSEQKKNEANSYTNTQINTVNSRVSNAESNINVLKNQISTKVSQTDIDKTVNNIKFGGVNLLSNTFEFENLSNWSLSKGPGQNGDINLIDDPIFRNVIHIVKPNSQSWFVLGNYPIRTPNNKFEVGKEYTISFMAKANRNLNMWVAFMDGNGTNSVGCNLQMALNTGWNYYKGTFKASATGNTPELYITMDTGEIWITKIKLSEGNKDDGWSICPFDINQKIQDNINNVNQKINTTTTEFTQKTNSISQKVNQVENTTNSLNGRVTNTENRISNAESKLTPNAIVNSVNSSISSGGVIRGASTILDKDKFTVKDNDNSRVELEKGCITAFNGSNKRTYYMNENEIGICAKDNSDSLGMLSSVYKNTLNDFVSKLTPGGSIKGVGLFAGDYAQFLTFGHDNLWGNDSRYDEYLTFNKKGYAHFGVGVDLANNEIQNVPKINFKQSQSTLINALAITRGQVNVNTEDGDLWLNYAKGPDTYNKGIKNVNVRIGAGWNSSHHGSLICQDLWVHGNKHNIVNTKELGFVGLHAYEMAEPQFGDNGGGVINKEGYCYIYLDPIFVKTVNTNIEYRVHIDIISDDLNAKVQCCDKQPNYFKVVGTPGVKFDWEVKCKRKGYENNRLDRINECVKMENGANNDNLGNLSDFSKTNLMATEEILTQTIDRSYVNKNQVTEDLINTIVGTNKNNYLIERMI